MNAAPDIASRPPPSRLWVRVLVALALLLPMIWAVGFLRFVDSIARLEPAPPIRADVIVVLTGGAKRVAAGFGLLNQGKGEALFVSGVFPDVRPDDLRALAEAEEISIPDGLLACCVALGFSARDTRGNATEIAGWLAARDVRSVLMVTSNYHVPRSLMELQNALPAIKIHPYPVVAGKVMLDAWWRWPGSLRLLAGEYHKLILAGFRLLTPWGGA
ncbi:MAG: YdcF family protein [Proteobacteria bacterium]|nr:YdcF family protein [Pseudomonadota bacterium]